MTVGSLGSFSRVLTGILGGSVSMVSKSNMAEWVIGFSKKNARCACIEEAA